MTRYKSPPGWHRHQCPVCGVVWEHRDHGPDKHLDAGRATSDKCPTLGCPFFTLAVSVIYLGRLRPAYTTQEVTTP